MNEDQLPEEILAWIKLNNPRRTMEGSYDFQKGAELMYYHLKSHTVEGDKKLKEVMVEAYKLIKTGYWHNAADMLFNAFTPQPFAKPKSKPDEVVEGEKNKDKNV